MTDIIKQINDIASLISEQDLDEWIVPKLLDYYSTKINSLANKTYGVSLIRTDDGPSVAQKAFKERAKAELRSALFTFIFKSEHWKTGRDINTYLLTSLNRLSDRVRWDLESIKKINALICPACKFLHKREFLTPFGQLWKCGECNGEQDRAKSEIQKLKGIDNSSMLITMEARYALFKAFALHSRKGYRCPDCERFVPESCNGPHGITCPYPDCIFSGKVEKLEKMSHPVGLTQRNNLSLQTTIDNEKDSPNIQDMFAADVIEPDVQMEVNQNFEKEYSILKEVINQQLSSVKRTNSTGTMLQKVLMYEAYINMVQRYPEDMVSYLVHRKQNSDIPIQSKIFQEYVRLMQDALPCTITRGNKEYEIVSLMDPNISLFEGISIFDAVVRSDNTIPNNTVETYTGGRKFKDYGPCFIGMVIDVTDRRNDTSIRNAVVDYSFVQIKLSDDIMPGTPVTVKHYRMASHYEMGSLVYLQRSRKRIVNSVYYKIHKKIRVPE
jgi:hypothetical protein